MEKWDKPQEAFRAGDHVVIVSGPLKGTTGIIRRTFGRDEKAWLVDYDGYASDDRNGCGHHRPHELQHVQ
jgi:hypothetical protein